MRRWARPSPRVLSGREVSTSRILDFCSDHPVQTALMAEPVQMLRWSGAVGDSVILTTSTGRSGGTIRGVCWVGGNIVPVGFEPEELGDLARTIRRRGMRYASIVGPAEQVLGLWEQLRSGPWQPRDLRPDQPSMEIASAPLLAPDERVRPTTIDDLDLLLPASVAMFTEEVGYSPLTAGGGYERRVRELVVSGRSLVRIDDGPDGPHVVFKADLGTVGFGVTQLQGVWIHPDYRGRGMAAAAVAAVVEYARQNIAPRISLYVNSYNHRALATYDRVGFTRTGTFASVLF